MNREFWVCMCLLGVITFGIRWSFLAIAGSWKVSDALQALMKHIPAAVFAALSVPALFYAKPVSYELQDPAHLVAALVGLCVAYFSKNVLFTIASGLGCLWLCNALFVG